MHEILKLYLQDLSAYKIARELNLDPPTVYASLKAAKKNFLEVEKMLAELKALGWPSTNVVSTVIDGRVPDVVVKEDNGKVKEIYEVECIHKRSLKQQKGLKRILAIALEDDDWEEIRLFSKHGKHVTHKNAVEHIVSTTPKAANNHYTRGDQKTETAQEPVKEEIAIKMG